MTIRGFLDIPSIEGSATNDAHAGEVEVSAMSWHIGQDEDDAAAGTTSRRRSKVPWTTFDFAKSYDTASLKIIQAVESKKLFDEIVFSAQRGADDGQLLDFLTISMRNAQFASYAVGTGDNQFEEVVSIRCEKLHLENRDVDPTNGTVASQFEIELPTN